MKKRKLKKREMITRILAIFTLALTLSFVGCNQPVKESASDAKAETVVVELITAQEVLDAQHAWGEGVVKIGQTFLEKGDYKAVALKHIDDTYGYDLGPVLFKPTMAAQKQFRTDKEGALSYFVAGNADYPEDHGFAIKPWTLVRWETLGIQIIGNMAITMGNYYFTPADGGNPVKVEYSMAYTKDDKGKLRIILHGSHFPYNPSEQH